MNCSRVRTVLRTSSGDVSSVLSIKSAILDDAGNYTCKGGGLTYDVCEDCAPKVTINT